MDTQLASDQMASSKNETETGDQLTLASPNMYALNTAEYLLTIKRSDIKVRFFHSKLISR